MENDQLKQQAQFGVGQNVAKKVVTLGNHITRSRSQSESFSNAAISPTLTDLRGEKDALELKIKQLKAQFAQRTQQIKIRPRGSSGRISSNTEKVALSSTRFVPNLNLPLLNFSNDSSETILAGNIIDKTESQLASPQILIRGNKASTTSSHSIVVLRSPLKAMENESIESLYSLISDGNNNEDKMSCHTEIQLRSHHLQLHQSLPQFVSSKSGSQYGGTNNVTQGNDQRTASTLLRSLYLRHSWTCIREKKPLICFSDKIPWYLKKVSGIQTSISDVELARTNDEELQYSTNEEDQEESEIDEIQIRPITSSALDYVNPEIGGTVEHTFQPPIRREHEFNPDIGRTIEYPFQPPIRREHGFGQNPALHAVMMYINTQSQIDPEPPLSTGPLVDIVIEPNPILPSRIVSGNINNDQEIDLRLGSFRSHATNTEPHEQQLLTRLRSQLYDNIDLIFSRGAIREDSFIAVGENDNDDLELATDASDEGIRNRLDLIRLNNGVWVDEMNMNIPEVIVVAEDDDDNFDNDHDNFDNDHDNFDNDDDTDDVNSNESNSSRSSSSSDSDMTTGLSDDPGQGDADADISSYSSHTSLVTLTPSEIQDYGLILSASSTSIGSGKYEFLRRAQRPRPYPGHRFVVSNFGTTARRNEETQLPYWVPTYADRLQCILKQYLQEHVQSCEKSTDTGHDGIIHWNSFFRRHSEGNESRRVRSWSKGYFEEWSKEILSSNRYFKNFPKISNSDMSGHPPLRFISWTSQLNSLQSNDFNYNNRPTKEDMHALIKKSRSCPEMRMSTTDDIDTLEEDIILGNMLVSPVHVSTQTQCPPSEDIPNTCASNVKPLSKNKRHRKMNFLIRVFCCNVKRDELFSDSEPEIL